jgi:hypothetical protein
LEGVEIEDSEDDFSLLRLTTCRLLLLERSIAAVPPLLASRRLVLLVDLTDQSLPPCLVDGTRRWSTSCLPTRLV